MNYYILRVLELDMRQACRRTRLPMGFIGDDRGCSRGHLHIGASLLFIERPVLKRVLGLVAFARVVPKTPLRVLSGV
jgi:hypothetical protein